MKLSLFSVRTSKINGNIALNTIPRFIGISSLQDLTFLHEKEVVQFLLN